MSLRKTLIAGNWKMNKTAADGVALTRDLSVELGRETAVDIVLCPPFTALESVESPYAAFALVMAALVIVTGYTSINAVVKAELFPAHIRALGVALPYAIANTVFGGTAEYVALWLKDAGMERVFYWYVAAMIALSLVVYATMRDTKAHSRILED